MQFSLLLCVKSCTSWLRGLGVVVWMAGCSVLICCADGPGCAAVNDCTVETGCIALNDCQAVFGCTTVAGCTTVPGCTTVGGCTTVNGCTALPVWLTMTGAGCTWGMTFVYALPTSFFLISEVSGEKHHHYVEQKASKVEKKLNEQNQYYKSHMLLNKNLF